jgi:hypothetical protein
MTFDFRSWDKTVCRLTPGAILLMSQERSISGDLHASRQTR